MPFAPKQVKLPYHLEGFGASEMPLGSTDSAWTAFDRKELCDAFSVRIKSQLERTLITAVVKAQRNSRDRSLRKPPLHASVIFFGLRIHEFHNAAEGQSQNVLFIWVASNGLGFRARWSRLGTLLNRAPFQFPQLAQRAISPSKRAAFIA